MCRYGNLAHLLMNGSIQVIIHLCKGTNCSIKKHEFKKNEEEEER